jgi:uncharacterized iron-regulated membrane protein
MMTRRPQRNFVLRLWAGSIAVIAAHGELMPAMAASLVAIHGKSDIVA